jgi:hypothetical protein
MSAVEKSARWSEVEEWHLIPTVEVRTKVAQTEVIVVDKRGVGHRRSDADGSCLSLSSCLNLEALPFSSTSVCLSQLIA